MENKIVLKLAILLFLAGVLKISNGCQIGGGVTIGPVPYQVTILDTLRGIILSETTTDIQSLISVTYGQVLVSTEAYLDISHENNQLIVQTSNAFDQYEANEVAETFSANLNFECAGGSTSLLTLMIHITDTNNHYPEFLPTNTFDFVLTAPVAPGFVLTGCLNEIVVRDVDLTTSAINFEIEDNPYFHIEYDTEPCPAPGVKQYKARLSTITFIRNFREPMTLRITATDVDATGDPPLSTSGTIRITGNPQFEFPEEPVFSQTLYFATYTEEHQLILPEPITLMQGFDENVNFNLDGEYKDNFSVNPVGNQVLLIVSTPLALDTLEVEEIYLILVADKEYTSGSSATIVIRLPEVTPLSFESAQYRGSIVDNSLQLSPLVLSKGYEGVNVSAEVVGEFATSFTATVEGNLVTVTMSSIADHIIESNSFIPIQVLASTGRSQATTIVTLEIIKDDSVTPAFDKALYTGSYDPTNGLNIEEIAFEQGFDESVEVNLFGEHRDLFQLNEIGPIIRLTSTTIPPELFEEQRLTISIVASKPRTVGANAAIIISLPSPSALDFEEDIYKGSIHEERLTLPSIWLSSGYDTSVVFNLGGDYSTYFDVRNEQNQVTIYLQSPLPDDVITQNTVIILTLTASGINAITTTASVVLDVIKEDTTTPVFNQNIYYGTYRGPSELEIENIFLSQGFNSEVSFKLDGTAHSQYFDINITGNSATITLRTAIPEDVIFNEKVLLFNVLADKALTVGSNAAVLIRFPTELTESTIMKFSQNYYIGAYEENTVLLDDIILDTGYAIGTDFVLDGDHADHFIITHLDNTVLILSNDVNYLPPEIIADNDFIILTVEARRERAVSVMTTVIIDIVKEVIVKPVFNQAYYRGAYNDENELEFTENISLLEGYESMIEFVLEGEQSTWFRVTNSGNSVTLVLDTPIPQAILDDNNHLMFSILALNVNGAIGRSVISIDVTSDNTLSFSRNYYKGYITEGIPTLELLSIDNFIIPDSTVSVLSGDYSDYFQVINVNGLLQLELRNTIPNQILQENNSIVLTLEIQQGNTRIRTIIILEIVSTDIVLTLERTYYVGSYSTETGLEFDDAIRTIEVDFDTVQFDLEGDDAQWFDLEREQNSVQLILQDIIPPTSLLGNQLIFEVIANIPDVATTRATIIVSIRNPDMINLGFDRVTYVGSIENDQTNIGPIILSEGYVPGVVFELHGELRDYFIVTSQEALVTVTLQTPISEQSIPANRIIALDLQASAPQSLSAFATLVFKYVVDVDTLPAVELIFAQTYYTGSYTEDAGLVFTTPISLADGYDENVQFVIEGDQGQWFSLVGSANSQTLVLSSPIPTAVLLNNQQLVFAVNALRTGSTTTAATIVISLLDEHNENLFLGFDRVTYIGSIENDQTYIGPIRLSEGYAPGVVFELHGELRDYFIVTSQEALVTVTLQTPISEQSIPANRIIALDLQASAPESLSAFATLVFKYVVDVDTLPAVELIFAQTYYTGSYTEDAGLVFTTPISLADGYDENVQFVIEGDQGQWFSLVGSANSQTLVLSSPIPTAVLLNNQQLVFAVNALRTGSTTTGATIVIALPINESQTGSDESFDKVLFEGVILNGVVNHETITVTGFTGQNIELFGEYAPLFGSEVSNGEVTIRATGTLALPAEVTHLAIELHAGSARAVLLLDVEPSDVPTPTPTPVPVVSFTSLYYAVRVTIADSGLVGRVEASADNGEDISYSLQLNNGHLQERLSINDAGELYLSAPVSPGTYTFHVVATTVNSLQTGTAVVDLTSEAITTCDGEIVMPPLIVLERDEEQPHYNLINSNEGCHFTLTNRWPFEQTWLFVDETGLHTTSIDREDASIAFMAVSQVQIEINLHCETDETRTKRSLSTQPDSTEYGSNRWVLTESIAYNSRRTLVNLIVHDINDNSPVFVGKDQEPIVVGYPVTELEERVLPRSLAELQATDADIGENAELRYWSNEPVLAVAPTTGFVHVRDGATLEHDARLSVSATDRNGHEDGLTGSIDILVKLLDESNIAVVTIRDAFLDNEGDILTQLSASVGYEIRVLRSVVISDDENNEATRKNPGVTSATGASLQLYVYGLIEREPVTVERLTTDITNAVIAQVTVASTVSLGDHLSDQEICVISGRDTGLLVATIVLSVLLFIIIVLILVWLFLRWRKNRNYDQFSDVSSLASRIDAPDQLPKPLEVATKPRLNIEELKKSERRLQEMLDAPIPEVTVESTPSRKEAVLNMPTPQDTSASIVIQSIDKLKTADDSSDDEYGEVKRPNRKSVVTFNENVEKIIHVQEVDAPLEDEKLGYEIYKF